MSRLLELVCHPDTPPGHVDGVSVELIASDDDILLTYSVRGAEHLLLPERQSSARSDGLWKTTCFELFLRAEGQDGYFEFNFSPSRQWSAYSFSGYRKSRTDWRCAVDPVVTRGEPPDSFVVAAKVDLGGIAPASLRLGLSAVIEEIGGGKSYWALVHPPGKPDFHDSHCFALDLAAPDQT